MALVAVAVRASDVTAGGGHGLSFRLDLIEHGLMQVTRGTAVNGGGIDRPKLAKLVTVHVSVKAGVGHALDQPGRKPEVTRTRGDNLLIEFEQEADEFFGGHG